MIGVRNSRPFSVRHHNGLRLLKTSVKIFYMKLEKLNGTHIGVKRVYIIWFVIVKIGVFLVNVHGEDLSQFSTVKMENQLLLKKRLIMYQNYSVNMAQTFGLSGTPKIYYLKASLQNIVRMVSLRKKQILWTFGSTLALHTKLS